MPLDMSRWPDIKEHIATRVCRILIANFRRYSPQYPSEEEWEPFQVKWKNVNFTDLPGFQRAYIRFGREEIVFSNLRVVSSLRGKGLFSAIVQKLSENEIEFSVEFPHSRLEAWCERNNIGYRRREGLMRG